MFELDNVVTQKRSSQSKLFRRNPVDITIDLVPFQIGNDSSLSEDFFYIRPIQQLTTSFRSGASGILSNGEIDPRSLIVDSEHHTLYPYDTGHEFLTWKESFVCDIPTLHGFGNGVRYVGPAICDDALDFLSKYSSDRHSFSPINLAIGTEFLSQLRPTKAAANVAQALVETIRDVPKIPFNGLDQARKATQLLRTGSDEYLNIVFGWSPLVSDVLKICRAIVNSDKILQQYRRDSGRQIRRRAANPVQQTDTGSESKRSKFAIGTDGYYGSRMWADSGLGQGVGMVHKISESTEKYWFSGAFSYLLTGDEQVYEKSARFAQLANRLLGVRPDITLLWELTPWSWLADWFTNIGAVINLNNDILNDNLVVRYGYLMRESVYTIAWQHDGVPFYQGGSGPFSTFYKVVRKERVRATPYGFGFDLTTLSASQLAILASLGLTKSPGKFWWG